MGVGKFSNILKKTAFSPSHIPALPSRNFGVILIGLKLNLFFGI